ncbi:MAG: copper-binding protein [Rhodocyclaceae bacterium]|nr:copper-binding protein [Rhodocyclaceae bacterium]
MRTLIAALAVALLSTSPAFAEDHSAHAMHGMAASAKSTALSEGTVKKLDKAKNRVTIAHGPIANLDMGAMTMTFVVAKPASLDKVKVGDKVRFQAEEGKDDLMINRLEVVK